MSYSHCKFSAIIVPWEKYDPSIDLIFLDIQMRLLDGLHTAERLRQMDGSVGIIFLTTLTQYGLEGFGRRRRDEVPSIVITNDSGKYKVPLKSIRYVETFKRNLLFHTEQEEIISYRSMKEMEQELSGRDFVRCHTSYLVNLFYIKGVKKLDIELISGEHIPVSQPKRKEFMEKLTEYWGDFL